MEWYSVVAIIISVVALFISVLQFFMERRFYRNEATINAFSLLQKDVLEKDSFKNVNITDVINFHELKTSETDKAWELLSEQMARIEQFSVGVNTNVYSIKIVDRMAGSHLIKEFERLKPIIDKKRINSKTNKRYEEFEKMVDSLKKKNF